MEILPQLFACYPGADTGFRKGGGGGLANC